MILLNILYNFFTKIVTSIYNFGRKTQPVSATNNVEIEQESEHLRASILIGVDKKQQYFFDIQWDYEDTEKTANDLANLILGLTYGLFMEQIKNLINNTDINTNDNDRIIIHKTIDMIQERSIALNKLLNSDSPIIKPSEVFRSHTDVNKT